LKIGGLGPRPGQALPEGGGTGKLLSPTQHRTRIVHVRQALPISVRRTCAAPGQRRSIQRKTPRGRDDGEQRTDELVALVREHGRLGYRKKAALRRCWPGISISTSLRSLAISKATSTAAGGIGSRFVMVGLSRRGLNIFILETSDRSWLPRAVRA